MRRWACVITLLVGFAGEGYTWAARPRPPVPIVRPIQLVGAGERTERTLRWWLT
jgi:hypothetical protein